MVITSGHVISLRNAVTHDQILAVGTSVGG